MANDNVIAFTPRKPKPITPITRHTEADRLMSAAYARVSEATENGFITPEDAANDLICHAMTVLFGAGMSATGIETTLREALDREMTSSFFTDELDHEAARR